MVLDFINEIYYFLFIPFGLVAIFLGVDRALKKYEEESKKLQILGAVTGLIGLAMIIILAVNEFNDPNDLTNDYNILFGVLLSMSLFARPFKKLPVAFVISIVFGFGLFFLFIYASDNFLVFNLIEFKYVLLGIIILVVIVFIIGFIQEQVMDGLLFVLSWGPIITILGLLMFIQGIVLIFKFNGINGIFEYLPG
ncbi:MAG: hypothetical protein OEZ01_01105 [Candidatus Heimdallarchaeota archaeon]|nr:hypothetical protein [Candidatus Heimdallarchaeota archaeon]MDH5644571.1 hypothetical protein [Candidatus Heimdallarchaeota archaeon]